MDNPWVGGALALAGVAVGAASQWFLGRVTFKRDKAWAIRDERRLHLEQLWEVVEATEASFDQSTAEAAVALRSPGKVPDFGKEKVPWARMRLLVYLYLPEFEDLLKAVQRKGEALGVRLVQTVSDRFSKPIDVLLRELKKASDDLHASTKVMKDAIAQNARVLSERKSSAAGE